MNELNVIEAKSIGEIFLGEGAMASLIQVRIQEVLRERGYTDPVKLAYESGISYGTCHTLISSGNTIQRIDLTTLGKLCRVCQVQVGDFLLYVGNGHKGE